MVAGISVLTYTPYAEASAIKTEKEQSVSYPFGKFSFDQSKEPTIDEIAQYWDLNEEATVKFKKTIKEYHSKTNGEATVHGKFTVAIKAIKGAYDQLPRKLKVMIGGVTGLETILITLEHYTGALEHGIYLGALQVTGNKNAAWWVAKTIMLFVF